jgi:hypothetical protein
MSRRPTEDAGMKMDVGDKLLLTIVVPIATWATIFAFDYQRVGETDYYDLHRSLFVRAGLVLLAPILAAAAWLASESFRTFVSSRQSLWIIALIAIASFVGFLRGNSFELIATDMKIVAWLYGGYALGCLFLNSGRSSALLFMLTLSVYILLITSAKAAFVLDDTGRIGGGVYWDYSELSFVAIGLLYSYLAPYSRLGLSVLATAVVLHSYYVINLGANRSDLLAFSVFCSCGVAVFAIKPRAGGFLRFRSARKRILLIIFLLLAGLSLVPRADNSFFYLRAFARLRHEGVYNQSMKSRVDELTGFFEQSSIDEIIIGRGLGGTIWNVTGRLRMNYMHIAAFEFLMKFGLIPFIVLIFILYFKVPLDFLLALFGGRSIDETRVSAILTTYPFVIGWLALTMMSGGIDWYYALGLGMLWAGFDIKIGLALRRLSGNRVRRQKLKAGGPSNRAQNG